MLKWIFDRFSRAKDQPAARMAPAGAIGDDFQPVKGSFFQTLEYPVTGEDNKTVTGRTWMEAGLNAETGKWVLWVKSVKEMEDALKGGTALVRNNRVLFEATSFSNAYAQMATFAESMNAQGVAPLSNKTPAKLGGDYFRQFAWRENLMMSRADRLYPVTEDLLTAGGFFNEQDLIDAKAFIDRHNREKFVPVPIVLPATDWEKAYNANKARTDQRLRALYARYNDDRDSFDLARQIVAHEDPAVLYAHLKNGFNPKIFETFPDRHYELLAAAIDRESVEPLSLLSEASLSFFVRHNGETPVEHALRGKRYSHLHIMLTRDGVKLANYADEGGTTPAVQAIELKDNQAFRMLYLEGIDYTQADDNGWHLIHHAFAHDFVRGIYAWTDEGLPVDQAIAGTPYTGLSIARQRGLTALVKFAQEELGADPRAPDLPAESRPERPTPAVPDNGAPDAAKQVAAFSLALLGSAATNEDVKQAAQAYVAAGGDLNALDESGLSVLEICWKNHKQSRPDLDRRALIGFFGALGADPSATLSDGTTVLTRAAKSPSFDLPFIQAVAPYARDVNNPDAGGDNIMHALQLNANDQVGHSRNIQTVLDLFPALDLNRQNDDGYSNIGLAIRLGRANTLKAFIKALVLRDAVADFTQTTKAGWSYPDLAFTAAFGQEKWHDFPVWANNIDGVSDTMRDNVCGMLNRVFTDGDDGQRKALYDILNRRRPDGRTLAQAMAEEKAPDALVGRLAFLGMRRWQDPAAPRPGPH